MSTVHSEVTESTQEKKATRPFGLRDKFGYLFGD